MRVVELNEKTKAEVIDTLGKRSFGGDEEIQRIVDNIIEDVRENGDDALVRLTEGLDGVKFKPEEFRVSKTEIDEAYKKVDDSLIETIKKAIVNIRSFHEKQVRQSFITTRKDGVMLGQRITPIEKVGVYVPGGRAPLSSSVLMNVIPAKVAGVERIVMMTPPAKDGSITPEVLVAADLAGCDEIYKIGGAQAVAALAYGTKTVPKVYKIVGPGNIFVTLAKKAVFGTVGIDSVAGPSEILVLADETATPEFVACDLLSQAEHDPMSSAVLVTTDKKLAKKVEKLAYDFAKEQSRREIIEKCLDDWGFILVAKDMDEAVEIVNEIASEHLEILTKNAFEVMTRIKNAGAIFLGEHSCEPLGDYFAGPDHVLPTCGTAKFSSPLSVDEFIKKSSLISYSREALEEAHEDIIAFAKAEKLYAHANSIAVRFGKEVK